MIQEHCQFALVTGTRRQTIEVRSRVLRLFEQTTPLATATRSDVLAFLSRDITVQSRVTYLLHLRAWYRWALAEGILTEDPTVNVPRPRVPRRAPRPIPDADLALALTAPKPLRDWFILAAYAGLRACEIAPLRGDDVRDGYLTVREGKGGHAGVVPAHPLIEYLVAGYGTRDRLWERSAKHVTSRSNTWLHTNGVSSTLHTLRHWAGTNVLRSSGGNLRVAQEFLRHQSPASTAIYTQVSNEDLRAAVNNLPAAA